MRKPVFGDVQQDKTQTSMLSLTSCSKAWLCVYSNFGCAGWSATLLFAYGTGQVFSWHGANSSGWTMICWMMPRCFVAISTLPLLNTAYNATTRIGDCMYMCPLLPFACTASNCAYKNDQMYLECSRVTFCGFTDCPIFDLDWKIAEIGLFTHLFNSSEPKAHSWELLV